MKISFGRGAAALAAATLALAVASTSAGTTANAATTTPDPLCVTKPSGQESGPKILTIGESLTSGAAGDYTWRYFLWKHLVTNGGTSAPAAGRVNMVGPYTSILDPVSLLNNQNSYVCKFDTNHFAIPSVHLAGYLNMAPDPSMTSIEWAVRNYAPSNLLNPSEKQVLIIAAGSKDLIDTTKGQTPRTPDQLVEIARKVLAGARKGNPNIKVVFVSLPLPPAGMYKAGSAGYKAAAKGKSYNDKIAAKIAGSLLTASWSTSASKVVMAKTATNWGKLDMTYDGVHPNAQGEVRIATDVATALNKVGVGPVPKPMPNLASYIGPRTAATWVSATVSGTKAKLSWILPPGAVRTRIERRDITSGGAWAVRAEKGLIDGTRCTDSAGHQVGPGDTMKPPYRCSYTDTLTTAKHKYEYRLRVAKGLIGTSTPQNPKTQLFLYSASLRSSIRTLSR